MHYISQRKPRRAEQETTVDALGESEAGERINGGAGARLAALALPALLQRALLEIAHGRHRCAASAAARADRMTRHAVPGGVPGGVATGTVAFGAWWLWLQRESRRAVAAS